MLEFVFEVIFSLILMYPGAFIRWVYYKGNKSYAELIDDKDASINTFVSAVFICLMIVIYHLI